jgi:hypothetical protein
MPIAGLRDSRQDRATRLARGAAVTMFFLVGAALVGCGTREKSKGPATVPVKGKVVFTRGGTVKSLFDRQARIELESVEQRGVRAVGSIEEDGSFVVATITPEGSNPGALAGIHRVRLDLEDNAQKLVAPQFLDFIKSGITIKLPSDQPVEVKIWR